MYKFKMIMKNNNNMIVWFKKHTEKYAFIGLFIFFCINMCVTICVKNIVIKGNIYRTSIALLLLLNLFVFHIALLGKYLIYRSKQNKDVKNAV